MFLRMLLVVSIMSVLAIGMANAQMEDAVAIWSFDEGSGVEVADSSGNDNTGTLVGEFNWVDGVSGGALEFDGATTFVDCGAGESIDFVGQQNFSVSAWVSSNTDDITDGLIIYKSLGCSTWAQYGFGVGAVEGNAAGPNKLNFYYRVANGGEEEVVTDEGDIPANEWVHVAGTYDGAQLKLYVNGALVATQDSSGAPWASAENLYLGGDPGCDVRYIWSGAMDEVMIFNVTLSDGDVQAVMGGTAAVSPAGKLATTWSDIKSH